MSKNLDSKRRRAAQRTLSPVVRTGRLLDTTTGVVHANEHVAARARGLSVREVRQRARYASGFIEVVLPRELVD